MKTSVNSVLNIVSFYTMWLWRICKEECPGGGDLPILIEDFFRIIFGNEWAGWGSQAITRLNCGPEYRMHQLRLLWLERKVVRVLFGLLTGHNTFGSILHLLGLPPILGLGSVVWKFLSPWVRGFEICPRKFAMKAVFFLNKSGKSPFTFLPFFMGRGPVKCTNKHSKGANQYISYLINMIKAVQRPQNARYRYLEPKVCCLLGHDLLETKNWSADSYY